ncbi:MAG: hypothetical protein AAF732_02025 [Pseudomonadota bacterium]
MIDITAGYGEVPTSVFKRAIQFSEIRAAMSGVAYYDGLPTTGSYAEAETYRTDIRFWGVLPVRRHTIYVAHLDLENRILLTHESHKGIRVWRHMVCVSEAGDGATWVDQITIDAGWQTPFVARFAQHVYCRGHRSRGASRLQSSVHTVA